MATQSLPTASTLRKAQAMYDSDIGFFSTNRIRLRQNILSVEDAGDAWLVTPKISTKMPTCDLFMPFELSKATLQPYL